MLGAGVLPALALVAHFGDGSAILDETQANNVRAKRRTILTSRIHDRIYRNLLNQNTQTVELAGPTKGYCGKVP